MLLFFSSFSASVMRLFFVLALAMGGPAGVRCAAPEVEVQQQDRLRWPGGVVHYSISDNFTVKQFKWIRKAMDVIEEQTCILFEERKDAERRRPPKTLYVMPGEGCTCRVGFRKFGSTLRLHARCFARLGHVVHELLHALGMRHEHQRYDRNHYVQINQTAIRPAFIRNFFRRKRSLSYVSSAGLPYDYSSIMHYPRVGFSVGRTQAIIAPVVPCAQIGQRRRLSPSDVARINRLYACTGHYLGHDIPGAVPFPEWRRHVRRLRRLEARSRW